MPDIFTKRKRSDVMSRIRGSGNKGTELRLIQIFRANDITGWRRGSKLPGKPDFVFPRLKTAVFVDGCFWHGCPKHGTSPKTRAAFWLAKIIGNKARDRRVNRTLRARGWKVLRIWEHELSRRNLPRLLKRLNSLRQRHSV
ncbi:MAG TPA: very short patch repair endonuclease [Lacunisphaera sp.]|jgi:DNA mismatch endonuclease (patch repair protein)